MPEAHQMKNEVKSLTNVCNSSSDFLLVGKLIKCTSYNQLFLAHSITWMARVKIGQFDKKTFCEKENWINVATGEPCGASSSKTKRKRK